MAVTKKIHKMRSVVVGDEVRYDLVFWGDVPLSQQPIYTDPNYSPQVIGTAGGDLTLLRSGAVIEKCVSIVLTVGETLLAFSARVDAQWSAWQGGVNTKVYPVVENGSWWSGTVWSTTPSQPSVDVTAPTISAIAVVNILTDRVTITCLTDDLAFVQAQVGVAAPTEILFPTVPSPLPAPLVASHSVTVVGLLANQLYKAKVYAVNAVNLSTLSSEFTFTTAAPASGGGVAAVPINNVDTALPGVGSVVVVASGGNLQAAIDS